MIEALIPIFGIVFSFGIPGIIIFWAIYTKHKERMRLIEKGLAPEEIKKYFHSEEVKRSPFRMLKWAVLLIFFGLGIVVANVLSENFNISDGVSFGLVMLFIGLGFLVSYLLIGAKVKDADFKEQLTNQKP
jgi:hypothetical protein